MKTIYLDYNATTPLDSAVKEAMLPYLDEIFGNPSSIHHVGRKARALLDDARDRVATVLKCKPSEVVFTSGGTESTNLAIFGVARQIKAKRKHIVTSTLEHHAVLHSCSYLEKEGFEVTYLSVDQEGRIDPQQLLKVIRPDTALVSIMSSNNEIGTIQDVAEIGRICRERGVLFHTDAVQSFGKEPFSSMSQFNADLVSICAHKFHGPKGAGVLYVKSPLLPDPILFGGAHENERRAGTENLAGIIGFAESLERFILEPVFSSAKLEPLSKSLERTIENTPGASLVSPRQGRLCNTVSMLVEGADSIALLAGLDMQGICASSGSACSAGSLEPSHVISALGVNPKLGNSLVRFSLGRESTAEEMAFLAEVLPEVVKRVRKNK